MTAPLVFESETPPREHMITVRVTDFERAILEAASETNGTSFSNLLRACINGPLLQTVRDKRPDLYKLLTNEEA